MFKTIITTDIETSDIYGKFDIIFQVKEVALVATPSSYTKEDIVEIEKYLQRYPNAITWTTMEGLTIPIKLIKDDHLKNIRKHMDSHFSHYGNRKIYKTIMKEWKKRFISSPAGEVLYGRKEV